MDQHTSGAQRAAEHEATAEQRAEWARRRRARADELGREVSNLALAAGAANTDEGRWIAQCARAAAVHLAAATRSAPPGIPERPPFADDLVVDRPPHEDRP